MNEINVFIKNKKVGEFFYNKGKRESGFNYIQNSSPISLIMPYKKSTYFWQYNLHPIFEMHLPEGYLFEIFKKYLSKEFGYIDDFLTFAFLAPNIDGRVTFESSFKKEKFEDIELEDVLENDTEDTFLRLVKLFLKKNAISGVQPKTLALLRDKESLFLGEYIIKTWGEEYPNLAENEYFCLKAVQRAGVNIPNIKLSKNRKFLLVEKFDFDKNSGEYLGFEEVLGLLGFYKDKKYTGSYEKVAKLIYTVTTDKEDSMKRFYKTVVMNYLLKNGDGHLKNFGILYDNEFQKITFAPAYDIVNTVVYIFRDKPALMMGGKRIWHNRKELIKFGIASCHFTQNQAKRFYEECVEAVEYTKKELLEYVKSNPSFEKIATRMIESFALDDNKNYKEIPIEIRRNWIKDKKS